MHLCLKIQSGMANSIDPDQEQSDLGSALFVCAVLTKTLVYKILGHLPYCYGNNILKQIRLDGKYRKPVTATNPICSFMSNRHSFRNIKKK